ncbi:hypothetical protein ACGFYF_42475 [Streptomyces lavendulae]|uniref:gp53-like domain-containing protein n=1 Tax=Streptomyces lavendulae TaxID=1914 RepID=UPI00371B668F
MSMIQTGVLDLDSTSPLEERSGNTSTFTRVTFPTPFPAGATVIVIPAVQTFNGSQTPGVRIANVTTDGFHIRFNEVYATAIAKSDGLHTTETVGWIATTA